ncbi:hypothetical protein ACQPZJ_19960 [Actinoplanes sp. CA-054009]
MRPNPMADLAVAGTAVAIFLVTLFSIPIAACTAAAPCEPEPVSALGLGALAAVAAMSYVHRWAAVAAAAVCVVLWPLGGRLEETGLGWRSWLPLLLLAVTIAVARLRWAPGPELEPAPAEQLMEPGDVGRPAIAVGVALIVAGLAAGGWTAWRQHQVTGQQERARTVVAVVREHADDDRAIVVVQDGGRQWKTEVLDAADYPVGSQVEFLVDDAGLRQLRAEPYDLTVWYVVFVAMIGQGIARLLRAGELRRGRLSFFAEPRPARGVRAVDGGDIVTVLLPGEPGRAYRLVVDVAGDGDEADEQARVVPATLYGEPRPGAWCAVRVGGELRVPARPVGDVREVPDDDDQLV